MRLGCRFFWSLCFWCFFGFRCLLLWRCSTRSASCSAHEWPKVSHNLLLLCPVRVGRRPCALRSLSNLGPVHVYLKRIKSRRPQNTLSDHVVQETRLENAQVNQFVGKHVNFGLLQRTHLFLEVHTLLVFNLLANRFPFLLKLQTIVVVLKSPSRLFFS